MNIPVDQSLSGLLERLAHKKVNQGNVKGGSRRDLNGEGLDRFPGSNPPAPHSAPSTSKYANAIPR